MIQWVSIHLWGHKEIKWKEILLNTGIWQVESEFQISYCKYDLRPDIVLLTILFYGSGQEEHSVSPDPIFLINSITMCLEYEKLLWVQVTVMIDWNNIFVKWNFYFAMFFLHLYFCRILTENLHCSLNSQNTYGKH